MNYRLAFTICIQAALFACVVAPADLASQEKKSDVPDVIRKIEKALPEWELFSKSFEITADKSKYDAESRTITWLFKAKMDGDFDYLKNQFSSLNVRFIDEDDVVVVKVSVTEMKFSTDTWKKGDGVRCSLRLPEAVKFDQVKKVDVK
jgi:hypothetical protein